MTTSREARIVEAAEQAAWEDLVRACPREVAGRLGVAMAPVGDGLALVCAAAPQVLAANRAFGFGLHRPVTEVDVDAALRFFHDHGVPGAAFVVGPEARPAAVRGWLEKRGLTAKARRVQLRRDGSAAPPVTTSLAVVEVTRARASAFGDAVVAGFGLPAATAPWFAAVVGRPGWRCVAAVDGTTVVASAALCLTGPFGWLGLASTLPTHRGRGAQSALLSWRVAAARAWGCEDLVAQTGPDTAEHPNPSLRNLRRAGFVDVYEQAGYRR